MTSATAALNLRQSQNLAISKPRAVYSIDQILGTQHHRRNNQTHINNNNNNGEYINRRYDWQDDEEGWRIRGYSILVIPDQDLMNFNFRAAVVTLIAN